jgi:cell division protein FtsI (penicillin-binding protein 3)
VASFAGFAPVSAPAISVTVVIDTPTVGSGYGAAVSAPVFHEVAQQVLEYLGVPHDQPVRSAQQMLLAQKEAEVDGAAEEDSGDLRAMFEQVNSLPVDDPLRQPARATALAANAAADRLAADQAEAARRGTASQSPLLALPERVMAAFRAQGGTSSAMPDDGNSGPVEAPAVRPAVEERRGGAVALDEGRRVAVPAFTGVGLRVAVESAAHAGLRVQPLGSGLAREQAPAAGTMVPLGTEVVVRFAR